MMMAPVGEQIHHGSLERLIPIDRQLVWVPSRALSIYQPWAYFMLYLPPGWRKDVENRSPRFPFLQFRGRFWVHSVGKVKRAVYDQAVAWARDRALVPAVHIPTWDQVQREALPGLARGAILGHVTATWVLPAIPHRDPQQPWRMPDHYGFVLRDPYAVAAPVRADGQQGFWRLQHDAACALARQLPGQVVADDVTPGLRTAP